MWAFGIGIIAGKTAHNHRKINVLSDQPALHNNYSLTQVPSGV